MKCVKCGASLKPSQKYCDKCGAQQPDTSVQATNEKGSYCVNCGQHIPAGQKFCTGCGTPADGPAQPSADVSGRKPKWIIPTIAVSVAGIIVFGVLVGTQALPGLYMPSTEGEVVTASPSASAAATKTTSPTATPAPSAASAAVSATAEPTPDQPAAAAPNGNFTLNDAQRSALLSEVVQPLLFSYLEDGSADSRSATIDPRQMPQLFWWEYVYALTTFEDSKSALMGRDGSDGVYFYDYRNADGPSNVPVSTLRDYAREVFGTDEMLVSSGLIDAGDSEFTLFPGDPASRIEEIGSDPVIQAENGIIEVKGWGGWWDDEVYPTEYTIRMSVTENPNSRYGCSVNSVQIINEGAVNQPEAPVQTMQPAVPTGFDADGFVFPDSSVRYLTYEELSGLSKEMLGFARNEIFARHGNLFRKDKYANHYSSYAWYNNIPNKRYDIMPEELSEIERANVNLILSLEG